MTSDGLCVVIPHCGAEELLDRAIWASDRWPILVVDDSPTGLEPIPDRWKSDAKITVIRLPGKSGFSVAANAGLQWAETHGYSKVLLLNDDAAPEEGCIEVLSHVMDSVLNVGAVGPVLVDEAGRIESTGLIWKPWLGRLVQNTNCPDAPVVSVDALSGACLLLKSADRFDEGFVHGFEDVELSQRLKGRGEQVLLATQARCLHTGGVTVDRRSKEATRAAVSGHLRLVGPGKIRRSMVLTLSALQIVRERGPLERFYGLWEGWRSLN